MAAVTSRFRSRLFKSLRLGVILNLCCSLLFVAAIFFNRSTVSELRRSLDLERLRVVDLSSRLNLAIRAITNDVFIAAGAFACSITNNIHQISSPALPRLPANVVSNVNSFVELPPLSFSSYFEVDGVPYIKLRNKFYKLGDCVLGYPITAISPDVVEYRDRFYKVESETKQ